jgi:hypothetical protein
MEMSKDRVVAFRPDRSDFVVPGHPCLHSIDGRKIQEWIEAARPFIVNGSESLVQSRLADELLPRVQFLREQIGLEHTDTVEVAFESEDGASRVERIFTVAERPQILTDKWPLALHKHQGDPYRFLGDFGYLRLDGMYGEPEASLVVNEAMSRFRNTRGLIVDVRGNTGGSTDILHAFLPYLMTPAEPPKVIMAARYRLGSRYDPDFPGWLLRADSPDWNPAQRVALEKFQTTFKPEWNPPKEKFSQWYFEVVSITDNPGAFPYNKPVIVIQDGRCFSATDVFLSALKGHRNVTLMGLPSAGGSGTPAKYELCVDWWCVLSRHIGFQADGLLFDSRGVQPDILIHPTPEYFIGRGDDALDRAIQLLRESSTSKAVRDDY